MNSEIKSFRDLIVWKKAMQLCREVYTATRLYPDNERFGLTAQSRRSAVSVPSNIAEGYGRNRTNDYLRFLAVARGSLYELDTQLQLGTDLSFGEQLRLQECATLLQEVDRMLNALIRSVEVGSRSERPERGHEID